MGRLTLELVMLGHYKSKTLEALSHKWYLYLKEREQEFQSIFGEPLYRFCDYSYGFDASKFWDEFYPQFTNGVSYNDRVTRDYGERAAQLIQELISIKTSTR